MPATTVPPVPLRMLNEFTYCPRLGYLEWVQGEWAENADTTEGEFVHRNVDKEEKKEIAAGEEGEEQHARSLRLEDDALGLVAVIDVLELEGSVATPIDYKKGKAPDTVEGTWEPVARRCWADGNAASAPTSRTRSSATRSVTDG